MLCFPSSWAFTHLNLNNFGTPSKDHTRKGMQTKAKMIPYLRIEALQNHTLSGSTYLSSLA